MTAKTFVTLLAGSGCLLPALASAHPSHRPDGFTYIETGHAGWMIGAALLIIVVAGLAAWRQHKTAGAVTPENRR